MKAKSPCINVCILDDKNGYCTGCMRSLLEIGEWASASETRRKQILDKLPERRKNLK